MLYLFEDYALDTDRHELRRAGAAVSVEPQVFDVLTFLVQNRERVVTRDDLLAAVWEGRIVSESTLSSRINAARVAIGDSGEGQRLIRTILRKGFRFVGLVREEQKPNEPVALVASSAPDPPSIGSTGIELDSPHPTESQGTELVRVETLPDTGHRQLSGGPDSVPGAGLAPAAVTDRPRTASRAKIIWFSGAAVAAAAAIVLLVSFLQSTPIAPKSPVIAQPVEKFDASVIPLVNDAHRRSLVSYPNRRDAKALAITYDLIAVVDGATDVEDAKRAALQQCQGKARTKLQVCRLYAAGLDVVWSRESMPMPAPSDLRLEPLAIPLVAADIPTLSLKARQEIAEHYGNAPPSRALALTTGGSLRAVERRSRSEAMRMAIEGCAYFWQRPCLLLSVDGLLTVQIPKTRRIDRIFLPSIEPEIPGPIRERVAEIYQGAEWRALAVGKNGAWEAVAGAASEADAIDAALQACSRVDRECRLYAIGNFHVANE